MRARSAGRPAEAHHWRAVEAQRLDAVRTLVCCAMSMLILPFLMETKCSNGEQACAALGPQAPSKFTENYPCDGSRGQQLHFIFSRPLLSYPQLFRLPVADPRNGWVLAVQVLLLCRLVLATLLPAGVHAAASAPLNVLVRLLPKTYMLGLSFMAARLAPSTLGEWYLRSGWLLDMTSPLSLCQNGVLLELVYWLASTSVSSCLCMRYKRLHPGLQLCLPCVLLKHICACTLNTSIELWWLRAERSSRLPLPQKRQQCSAGTKLALASGQACEEDKPAGTQVPQGMLRQRQTALCAAALAAADAAAAAAEAAATEVQVEGAAATRALRHALEGGPDTALPAGQRGVHCQGTDGPRCCDYAPVPLEPAPALKQHVPLLLGPQHPPYLRLQLRLQTQKAADVMHAFSAAALVDAQGGHSAAPASHRQPYTPRTRLYTTATKIQNAEPEDVPVGYEERLATVLAASGRDLEGVYLRAGCIELLLDSRVWTDSELDAPPIPSGAGSSESQWLDSTARTLPDCNASASAAGVAAAAARAHVRGGSGGIGSSGSGGSGASASDAPGEEAQVEVSVGELLAAHGFAYASPPRTPRSAASRGAGSSSAASNADSVHSDCFAAIIRALHLARDDLELSYSEDAPLGQVSCAPASHNAQLQGSSLALLPPQQQQQQQPACPLLVHPRVLPTRRWCLIAAATAAAATLAAATGAAPPPAAPAAPRFPAATAAYSAAAATTAAGGEALLADPALREAAMGALVVLTVHLPCPDGVLPELSARVHGQFLDTTATYAPADGGLYRDSHSDVAHGSALAAAPACTGAAAARGADGAGRDDGDGAGGGGGGAWAAGGRGDGSVASAGALCFLSVPAAALPEVPGLLLVEARRGGRTAGPAVPVLLVDDGGVAAELQAAVENWSGLAQELEDVLLDLSYFLHSLPAAAAAAAAAGAGAAATAFEGPVAGTATATVAGGGDGNGAGGGGGARGGRGAPRRTAATVAAAGRRGSGSGTGSSGSSSAASVLLLSREVELGLHLLRWFGEVPDDWTLTIAHLRGGMAQLGVSEASLGWGAGAAAATAGSTGPGAVTHASAVRTGRAGDGTTAGGGGGGGRGGGGPSINVSPHCTHAHAAPPSSPAVVRLQPQAPQAPAAAQGVAAAVLAALSAPQPAADAPPPPSPCAAFARQEALGRPTDRLSPPSSTLGIGATSTPLAPMRVPPSGTDGCEAGWATESGGRASSGEQREAHMRLFPGGSASSGARRLLRRAAAFHASLHDPGYSQFVAQCSAGRAHILHLLVFVAVVTSFVRSLLVGTLLQPLPHGPAAANTIATAGAGASAAAAVAAAGTLRGMLRLLALLLDVLAAMPYIITTIGYAVRPRASWARLVTVAALWRTAAHVAATMLLAAVVPLQLSGYSTSQLYPVVWLADGVVAAVTTTAHVVPLTAALVALLRVPFHARLLLALGAPYGVSWAVARAAALGALGVAVNVACHACLRAEYSRRLRLRSSCFKAHVQ